MSEPPIDPPVEPEPPIILGWDEAEVTGDRINVFDAPIIAGDPDGARVEITGDGIHSYNSAGIETSSIIGDGGNINAGSFATAYTDGTRIYMNNRARHQWPAIVFETPGLYRAAGIAGHDGIQTDEGVWPNGTVVVNSGKETSTSNTTAVASGPNGAQLVARSGTNRTYVVANANGNAELISSANSLVLADSLGGAKMEGTLGNRVLATEGGNSELQSSGGALVLATSGGNSELKSSTGATVTAYVSGGTQMRSTGGGLFVAHAAGETSMWAASTERLRATTSGVNVTGALSVNSTDVMAYIASLEARITALEA